MKTRRFNIWSILLAAVLLAALAAAPARFAAADSGGEQGHVFNVSFTKWITAFPNMAGVGGGAIGPASFTGEILSLTADGNMQYIEALYHFNGSKHDFTAHIFATQDNSTGTGTISGEITKGWLKGGSLAGEYNVYPVCPIETPGNGLGTLCFQGVLHLRRAP